MCQRLTCSEGEGEGEGKGEVKSSDIVSERKEGKIKGARIFLSGPQGLQFFYAYLIPPRPATARLTRLTRLTRRTGLTSLTSDNTARLTAPRFPCALAVTTACAPYRGARARDLLIVRVEKAGRRIHTAGPRCVRSSTNGRRLRRGRDHAVHLYKYAILFIATNPPCGISMSSSSPSTRPSCRKKPLKRAAKTRSVCQCLFHGRGNCHRTLPPFRTVVPYSLL